MTYTQKQLIARIERQIDINATIIERLGDDSAAASELAVEAATMDIKILEIALAALESRADAEPVAWVMKDDLADADIIFTPAYTSFSDAMSKTVGDLTPLYTRSQPAPAFPQASDIESLATNLMKRIDKITGERHSIATLSSLRVSIVDACRAAMLQGKAEPVSQPYKLVGEIVAWNHPTEERRVDFRWIDFDVQPGTKLYALNSPVIPDCWCNTCRPVTMTDSRFVVCPECGNKRCPHANDHRNACTGSNEPGQEGNAYPAAPQQETNNGN